MLRRAALALVLVPISTGCDEAPAASSPVDAPRPGGKADGAAPVSAIRFDADFAPPVPAPALIAGGSIAVDYDAQRFFDVYDGSGSLGWFASSFTATATAAARRASPRSTRTIASTAAK